MVLRKNRISPQYVSKNQITTTILDVINPAHYILKECPSGNSSLEAREFAEAEDSMQKYYESIEPCFFQMPVKDSIVVVRYENKFYRASVISILALSAGHLFKVYLLDYGKECSVPRNCLFEIQKDFLAHPFQAVNFKLLGIEPVSLVMSSMDLSVSYGPVSEWDLAAVNHIHDLQKVMCNAYIEVKAFDEKSVYGNLFLTFGDASVKCINEELVQKKYARYNGDCWKSVQSIDSATESSISSSKKSPVSKSLSPVTPNHHSPHSSKMVPKFEDLNVKFIRSSDGKVVGESSLMRESKSSSETLENQQQMISSEVSKQPIQTLPENTETSQKVQSESCKKLLMLQKLHRQKKLSNNQSSAQCDNLQKSLIAPIQITNTIAEDSLSKEPRKDLKNVDHDRPTVNKSKNINSGDDECDKINSSLSNEPKQSNVRELENSPKQGASSGTAEISPGNLGNLKKLQMLQKLKEMKRSHLQQPSEKMEGLKEGEKSEIKSQSCAKSSPSNSNMLSVSPRKFSPSSDCPVSLKEDSNVTQKSPKESSPKRPVDFQKVKEFYKKRQLFQNSSVSEKMSHALNIESEVQVDATPSEQNCDIVPTDVSTSDTSAVEKSETKPCLSGHSESEFHASNFITCSSPKTSSESVSTRSPDSKSDSNITNNCILPGGNRSVNTSHSNSSKDSIELMLDKLTMSPPTARLDSEILKTLSDMSDSDDILYQYIRKRESLSDKSDEDDFDVTLCTQLKHTELKQLMDFSQLSLWEKQRIPVLQIGENPYSPVLCVEEAPFSPKLHKVLKEIKFYGPSCIQSVIWPSLARTRSLIAIAPPHAGKTVAYVLPIVSYFMDQEGLLPEGNGPIYIILCSSWKKVQDVNDFLRFFLGNTKAKIVTLCADGGHYKSKVQTLINGCDILIATPFCLLNFFKTNSVSFYRCTGFYLDDGTTLITQNKKQLKYLLLHFMNGVKRKVKAPQLVVCAERWNKAFQIMIDKIMSRPLLFFTSFLESAIFAHISMFGHVCDPDEKMQAILGVLKDTGKVVICTTNAEDAKDIHHYLRCEDIKTYLATEQMEHFIADEVIKDWKSARCMTSSHCLVITDQALIRMCISSADCLIHYDVPHDSRLQFGNRFSCIAEHFQKEEDSQKCECHIFITKSDYSYASYLIDIIESAGGNASVELKALTEIENTVENKSNVLCKYMKAFGFCKERHCEHRHYIDPVLDKPQVTPCEGDIQGLVTQVVDASHYYVRLQKYLDVETNKTVSFNAAYAEVGFRLKDFYSSATKDMEVESPVVGENYVLAEENVFYRIKVLEKVNPASYTEFPKWKVLFLDEGWIKCYEKLKLYKFIDQIQIPDFLAFEVYICNILTPDSCLDWNPQTTHLISSLIKGQEIYGKIVLCLGSTLWLDPVVLRAHLHGINDYINQTKVHKKLIDAGHAKENNNHLNVLQGACTGKVPLPRIIKRNAREEEETQDKSSVSYAFLNCGVDEDVYVSSVISPERLYIQRAKFVQCLDDLLDKINGLVEQRILKKCSTICKGMHCIAPFHEDGRYYRAVISDIPSDEDVQLFFVDFGDTGKISKKDIFYLPPEFLLLPFQAIECELAGISAAHGGWTNSAIDMLYDFTRDDAGDMKILQLKAYRKTSSYEGGNHYVIDLWYDEKCLSEQLLLAGFGIPAEIPTETTHVYASDKTEEQVDDESFDFDDECSTSDREMHPEDKDAAALFCGILSNMVLQAYDGISNNAATITEVTSDDEKPINKPSNSSSSVPNTMNNLNLENNTVRRSHVVGDATLKPDSYKPLISWWDTPQQLSILINLKGIKVYHLDVTDESFTFNTVVAGIQYFTEEKLYAKIKGNESTKYQTAQGINIVAKKQTPFKWPRLIQEKKKFLHIKYDLIHIDDSDSDEASKDANNNEDIPVEASSSSSDEDEYCPPWKEVGRYKDPYNLLE